jgi:hypothetical protein
MKDYAACGGVAERFKAAVLKTVKRSRNRFQGSNPCPSANSFI